MSTAFIFPGQGSQTVGMGKELADNFTSAKEVFEEIDHVLKQNLSTIIFNGPSEELTLTENTQPALMAVSMAIIRVIEKEGKISINNHCSYVAGHSLGEYSALAASQAFTLADTARLLRIRGNAMQQAVPVGVGSMVAILGINLADAMNIASQAAEQEICQVANDNCPGQIVLSGNSAAIDRAISIATTTGYKAVKLPVSAPFHCALMQPAQDVMAKALSEVNINKPLCPVVANVTACATSDENQIRELLIKQVTGMVKWNDSIIWMKNNGVKKLVEIGAGKVLTGLTKRIDKEFECISIQTPQDIEDYLKNI